jgi:hypothetical protein
MRSALRLRKRASFVAGRVRLLAFSAIGIVRRWRRATVVGGDHGRVDGREEAAPLRQPRARRRRNSARSNEQNAPRGSAAIPDLSHARAAALSVMMPSATAHGSRRRARPRVPDGRPVAPGGRAAEGRGRSQSGAASERRPHRTGPQSTGGRLARRGDGDLPGPRAFAPSVTSWLSLTRTFPPRAEQSICKDRGASCFRTLAWHRCPPPPGWSNCSGGVDLRAVFRVSSRSISGSGDDAA